MHTSPLLVCCLCQADKHNQYWLTPGAQPDWLKDSVGQWPYTPCPCNTRGTDSDLSRADPVLPRYRPQNTYRLCQVPHTKRVIKYKHLGLLSFFFFNGDDMCLKLSCLKREILFYNHSKLVLVTVYLKSLILLPLLPTNNLQVLKQKLMFVPFGNNSLFGKTVS